MAITSQVPDSQFAFVVVAARRARQLMSGAPPLVDPPHSHKATRIAIEELHQGMLEYEIPDLLDEAEEKEGKRRKG